MAVYTVDVVWRLREGEDFPRGRYSRAHKMAFDGGVTVPASASPHVVGKWADAAGFDPEEMLVAALASCHMLSFLHVARLAGFTVLRYSDQAQGVMEEIGPGRLAVTQVVLQPELEWSGDAPDAATLDALHHAAHEACYIANSVRTEVIVAK